MAKVQLQEDYSFYYSVQSDCFVVYIYDDNIYLY